MRFSLLLLCSNLLLLAQTTPDKPEKGVLAGKVLNSVTDEPVRKAQVALMNMRDRKSTRLNSSHLGISYAVFCLKKKNNPRPPNALLVDPHRPRRKLPHPQDR